MKKTIFVLMVAFLAVSVFAQAPESVGTDYVRPAVHFFDGTTDFVNSDVFFKLSSVDHETGLNNVKFSLDGAGYMIYRNPFQILEEGKHDVSYKGHDNSLNVEIAKTFSVVVDNTAPRVLLETDKPVHTNGLVQYCSAETKWFVVARDNIFGSGVAAGYIGTDLGNLSAYGKGVESEEAYYNLTTEGKTNVYYTAIDNVGNLSPIAMFPVVVDMTPPTVAVENNNRLINKEGTYTVFPSEDLVDEEGRIIVSTNEAVSFSASDELSGVDAIYIKINDGEYTKYVEPIKFSNEDVYNLEVKAVDNVGNVSEPVLYTFFVDKITPDTILQLVDVDGNELHTTEAENIKAQEATEIQEEDTEEIDE